jgi:membrane protease YdiL (CAAX protease family)
VSSERLTSSDKRALLLWVAAGILGSLFAYKFFFRAFPEAAVNFQVSREEALQRAQKFVVGQGESLTGYQSAIVFDVDDEAKTYLEREMGLQQANSLMSSQLNIWYWKTRFFKPLQEEEFQVLISPAGQIAGYSHVVPKSQAGGALERAAAQTAAQDFLSGKLGINLNDWTFLPEEANSEKQPARVDWTFNWEKRDFRAKDAPYRLKLVVQGDRVGAVGQFLQVPDDWRRSFKQLRSHNDFLTQLAILPYVLVLAAALWLGIALTRRGQAMWGGAIRLGVVVAILLFCMQINELPIARAGYDTNTSYGTFLFQRFAIAVLFGVFSAITITLVLPAADALYRVSQPGNLRLGSLLTLRGLRSKEFFSAAIVGICMTGASLGFVVAFYLFGSKHGVWAPQDIQYANSVSTAFPWISGVAIGLLASTNEEFTFRLFAIPFVQRLTGSRWLAVILPAFCWSFLHTNYPQEPPYIRGIEIGIVGIAAGLVMLRWGIVATLIWHYTFDAVQVGLLLIRSNSLYFKISGAVVGAAALAPLAFACISYLSRGRFETSEDLLNSAEPAPDVSYTNPSATAETSTASARYEPLTSGMLAFLAVSLVVGGGLAWKLKSPTIGDYLRLSVNARSARIRADEFIRERGLDPNSFQHATLLVSRMDAATNEYLRERISIDAANEIYKSRVPGMLWRVRYFRDSQPEEYAVILMPDGSFYSIRHSISESAPGAAFTKEQALIGGEKFLTEQKKIDLSKWSLVEAKSDKRPHRIDHTLTWQENEPLDPGIDAHVANSADHAYARIELQILGNEVTNYRKYIQIPDDWRRKHSEETLARSLLTFGFVTIIVGIVLAALILFLKNLRSDAARAIPWRRLSLWAVWGLVAFVVVYLTGNTISNAYDQYSTAMPFKIIQATVVIGLILAAPFYFGFLAVLLGLAWYYAKLAFGEERIPGWAGMPSAYYRDAFWIAAGGVAGFAGFRQLLETIANRWPTPHQVLAASIGTGFDASVPAASLLASALQHGLSTLAMVALIAAFLCAGFRQAWLRAILFLLAAVAFVGANWGNPADFAKQFLMEAILLGVIVLGVRYIVRFNLLGGWLMITLSSLLTGAAAMLGQPEPSYRSTGFILLSAAVLLLVWPLAGWRMRSTQTPAY